LEVADDHVNAVELTWRYQAFVPGHELVGFSHSDQGIRRRQELDFNAIRVLEGAEAHRTRELAVTSSGELFRHLGEDRLAVLAPVVDGGAEVADVTAAAAGVAYCEVTHFAL